MMGGNRIDPAYKFVRVVGIDIIDFASVCIANQVVYGAFESVCDLRDVNVVYIQHDFSAVNFKCHDGKTRDVVSVTRS